ncbi:MAG: LPS export ABC transporter periplasmic protein LptC [Pseudomonadota bacterium]
MTSSSGTTVSNTAGSVPIQQPRADTERLSRFTPRTRKVTGGRGHSVLVGVLKLLLPIIAVLMIIVVIMWPTIEQTIEEQTDTGVAIDTPDFQASGEAQIINPRFTGLDESGRPFEIEGDLAYQDIDNPELIELDNLRGVITLAEGETARVESTYGRLDQTKGEVELTGNVVVSHFDGTVFRTDEIIVNISDNHVWGSQPVEAEADEATVTAEGFEVRDEGATVIFRGPAHMVVERGGQQEPPAGN